MHTDLNINEIPKEVTTQLQTSETSPKNSIILEEKILQSINAAFIF
jgi:hypothetical protein